MFIWKYMLVIALRILGVIFLISSFIAGGQSGQLAFRTGIFITVLIFWISAWVAKSNKS